MMNGDITQACTLHLYLLFYCRFGLSDKRTICLLQHLWGFDDVKDRLQTWNFILFFLVQMALWRILGGKSSLQWTLRIYSSNIGLHYVST